jgi:uncharacterized protein YyaL (SSP411 family)
MNLIRLGKIAHDTRCLEEGKGILRAFMGSVVRQPMAGLHFLAALDYLSGDETEISFSGRTDSPEAVKMLRAVHSRFIPGLVLRWSGEEGGSSEAEGASETTVHVCAGGACRRPVTNARDLEALLNEIL